MFQAWRHKKSPRLFDVRLLSRPIVKGCYCQPKKIKKDLTKVGRRYIAYSAIVKNRGGVSTELLASSNMRGYFVVEAYLCVFCVLVKITVQRWS